MTEQTSASNEPEKQEQDEQERYERIGAKLRRRREARSLEQGDVARHLHLPGMIVNDIETGQVDQLSSIYRRGYIRNYARFLDIDPDTLLADTGEDVLPELQEVMPVSKREWRLERYLKIATYAIVTVAIVPPLVYFFIAGGTRMLDRDVGRDEASAVASTNEPAATSSAPGKQASEGSNESAAPRTARHVSASALPINPVRPASESGLDRAASEAAGVEPPAEAAAEPVDSPLSAIKLQLLEDSWIEIHDAAGTRLEYDLLRSGQTRAYEGEAPFRLLVGRSSAVKLEVNGRAVTWEGHDSGDIAEIAVTGEGEVER